MIFILYTFCKSLCVINVGSPYIFYDQMWLVGLSKSYGTSTAFDIRYRNSHYVTSIIIELRSGYICNHVNTLQLIVWHTSHVWVTA